MKKKISLFVLLFLLVLTANFQTTNAAAKKNIYKIKVNKLKNTVTVYRHTKKGKYKPYKAFVCSSGKQRRSEHFHWEKDTGGTN